MGRRGPDGTYEGRGFRVSTSNLLAQLAEVACEYLGVHEEPHGSNKGPKLREFFTADDYQPPGPDEGYPWCASFVCRCVQRFMALPAGKPFRNIIYPRTARAFGLLTWGANNGCLVAHPTPGSVYYRRDFRPQPGDIVVFEFSHCGIVAAQAAKGRNFTAVEGNTNDDGSREGYEVAARPRTWSDARAFIRLTPTPTLERTHA